MYFKLFITFIFLVIIFRCSTKQEAPNMEKLSNGRYAISSGNLKVSIDPELGGRVVSLQIGEKEVLLQEREGLLNWGSTLWPAPQSRWNWPPPAAIQLGKYASKIQGDKLILESQTDTTFGLRAIKIFSLNAEKDGLVAEYRFINDSDTTQQIGPWEISCVPAGGVVFFPSGPAPSGTGPNMELEEINGIRFLKYEPEKLQAAQKAYCNSVEGWIAHVNNDNVLFLKSFDKIPAAKLAPGQGNVELYVSTTNQYMELENHGEYTLLGPGDSLSYVVRWYLRQLDNESAVFNQQLIDMVREMVP